MLMFEFLKIASRALLMCLGLIGQCLEQLVEDHKENPRRKE